MAEATESLLEPEFPPAEPDPESGDTTNCPGLQVVGATGGRTASKDARPITSLASVFGKFSEMQHMVCDHVVSLEESVQQQGRQLAEVSAQLPDMKERINWVIATYYEDGRDSKSVREQLARQEAGLAALTDTVRGLCEAQTQWKQTIEQLLQALGRVQNLVIPAPPLGPQSGQPLG